MTLITWISQNCTSVIYQDYPNLDQYYSWSIHKTDQLTSDHRVIMLQNHVVHVNANKNPVKSSKKPDF